MSIACPLCEHIPPQRSITLAQGLYHLCGRCTLVWLDPGQRPSAAAERAHYGTHDNDPADAGYRRFLDRLATPLEAVLTPGSRGLDFGCGPGPALARMLEERGFRVSVHDPFFAPDRQVLDGRYDFITCTETAEHFHNPRREFGLLDDMLLPGGWLGVMTAFRPALTEFAGWHYIRDPTHVCFYSNGAMAWIAAHYGWSLYIPARNVCLFRKSGGQTDQRWRTGPEPGGSIGERQE